MSILTISQRFPRPWLVVWVLGMLPVGNGLGSTGTATQTLNALVYPIAKVSVPGSASLTTGFNQFTPFQGNVPVSYWLRTTPTGGGNLTIKVTSDFSPAGGPSAAAGGLTYSCGAATIGTPCSGSQTASTTVQTPVLTLPASACTGGGGACSAQIPNSVTVSFTLADDPAYTTGTYSAKVTFVISAT